MQPENVHMSPLLMGNREQIDHKTVQANLKEWFSFACKSYFLVHGRSQKAFAKELHVSESVLSQYMSGDRTPSIYAVLELRNFVHESTGNKDFNIDDMTDGPPPQIQDPLLNIPATASPASHAPRRRKLGGGSDKGM